MVLGQSELLSFYFSDDTGGTWTNKETTESTVCHFFHLDSCRNPQALSLLPFPNSADPEGFSMIDFPQLSNNANHFKRNLNCISKEQVVIFYNDVLTKLKSDAIFCQDFAMEKLDNTDKTNKNYKNNHEQRDVMNRDHHFWNRDMEKKTESGNRRKSVSFADDVIVYLFDKESPTDMLHSEPSTSLNLHSEILFDDNAGLEWDDDFLALEKNCHPHNHREACPFTFPFPTQNWTLPKPKGLVLSQNCLFLTHVNESDLEL